LGAICPIGLRPKIKYHTVGKITKSNIKIDTANTQIHDRSLSWLGTDTSINSGGVKIILIKADMHNMYLLNIFNVMLSGEACLVCSYLTTHYW
jgi:hypothetical protein